MIVDTMDFGLQIFYIAIIVFIFLSFGSIAWKAIEQFFWGGEP